MSFVTCTCKPAKPELSLVLCLVASIRSRPHTLKIGEPKQVTVWGVESRKINLDMNGSTKQEPQN